MTSKNSSNKNQTKKKTKSENTNSIKTIDVSKVSKQNIGNKKNKKLYFGYHTRLFTLIILFICFFSLCLIFATKTLERQKLIPISYKQKSNVDYKVYLNENNFYEQDYLEMNKAYVASLIKYIDVNFNYSFNIASLSNINFNYKIIGELIIENNGGTKRYFEKKYTLLESKNKKLVDSNALDIKENIQIDYNYYNKLANSFRSTYGVDTNSYLNLYLDIKGQSSEKLNYNINENNKVLLKIPLSEKAIEISFDQNDREIIKQVIPVGKVVFNVKYLVLEIVFLFISILLFVKIVKYITSIMKSETKYDKFVKKMLKEYDRLIVETKTYVDLSTYNIIEVKSFTELLDVRDNLKAPILYYNITKHLKGVFYIKNDNDIYLLTIKEIDLENNK